MKTEEAPDFIAQAIFCDDIRVEFDQKVSYIGAYTAVMYVRGDFPVVIPKFAIALTFAQKREVYEPNLGIRIFLPGDTDDKASIEGEATATLAEAEPSPDYPMILMGARMVFTPFVIPAPGFIKVRVLRNELLHRCGSLRVLPFPQPPSESGLSPPS